MPKYIKALYYRIFSRNKKDEKFAKNYIDKVSKYKKPKRPMKEYYVSWDAYNHLLRRFNNLVVYLNLKEKRGLILNEEDAEKLQDQF
tara:strand:+ start:1531 stop:1791 length:261 start_codon:yes stop_codon:yes gene_type:complete